MAFEDKVMNRQLALAAALVIGAVVAPAQAEDIDLFLSAAASSGKPNVLFALDNSANWGATLYKEGKTNVTKKTVIHSALHSVLTSDEFRDEVRVGIMVFAHGNSPKGGKVLRRVRTLDWWNQYILASKIYDGDGNELLPGTNNAPYGLMMNEAYRYYAGLTPRSGTQDGNHDAYAIDDGKYISPTVADGCAKNFVIVIGNGGPDSGENNDAQSVLTALGGKLSSDPISLTPNNQESNWGDEFARFMRGKDIVASKADTQNIVTYVIDVFDPAAIKNSVDESERAFLRSIANQGGGRYFTAKNTDELIEAIKEIMDEVLAVNSVFASTTLPVSVNVRGTNLNQVYMGVFRPDGNKLPRWMGNLKLYQLKYDDGTDTLYLADKNGIRAESGVTGFITSTATSYWTTDSSFWSYHTDYTASDSPDGEIVEKGGAAQQLREANTRNLYTCTTGCAGGSALSGFSFATTNNNITFTGVDDATTRAKIINWVRGIDNKEDEDGDGSYTDQRASIHGDVLHSRPAVINYNRNTPQDENDIIAFYGANDGIFHAIYGGKDGESNDGNEVWGFIPPEFFDKLVRLYDNDVAISAAAPKPYFADGNIGVYQKDTNNDGVLKKSDGDIVRLYISMRRGGRLIYALDVSDPEAPEMLWKKSSADTGFGELGQTWSEPTVTRVTIGETSKDVLIFGGGYDSAANDTDNDASATMGRAIFMVDASDGSLIWQAAASPSDAATYKTTVSGMTYSIPSNVALLDTDNDGNADRIYVGDTGGNVWRADIGDTTPSNWTVKKLAAVGGTGSDARKFLYPPDVVWNAAGNFDAILIGSGDREHPAKTSVTNRFYMFKDTGPSDSWPLVESNLYDATDNLIQQGTEEEQAAAATALASKSGWYITLRPGEKVVSSAVSLGGNTFFNTHQPAPTSGDTCSTGLGIARHYVVYYADARAVLDFDSVNGLTKEDRDDERPGTFPPDPVPLVVEIDGKKRLGQCSGTRCISNPDPLFERRYRTHWSKQID